MSTTMKEPIIFGSRTAKSQRKKSAGFCAVDRSIRQLLIGPLCPQSIRAITPFSSPNTWIDSCTRFTHDAYGDAIKSWQRRPEGLQIQT